MKGNNIVVSRESMDELADCIEKNTGLISTAITMHFHNDEYAAFIEGKLSEIQYYMSKAYNPELLELKRQARTYYQKWLSLKDFDKSTANAVYIEYMQLKCKIEFMEIPF